MAETFQDTDDLVVCRSETNYKSTYADLKASLERDGIGGGGTPTSPVINDVTLTEDTPGGNRFSGKSFTTQVSMFADGEPVAQKEYVYKVKTDFTGKVTTDVQSGATPSTVTFASSNNLDQLDQGDIIALSTPADKVGLMPNNISFYSGKGGTDNSGNIDFVAASGSSTQSSTGIECVYNANTQTQNVLIRTNSISYQSQASNNGTSYSGFEVKSFNNSQVRVDKCTSYCLPTGQSILNGGSGGFRQIWYSENGLTWSATGGNFEGTSDFGFYGHGVSGDRMWKWQTGDLFYSTNKGQSWSKASNPIYPDSYQGTCVIDFGPHMIYWGVGPSNSGSRTYLITNKNSNLTSASEYQAISTPFSSEGPRNFSAYKHEGCVGGFFCVGSYNGSTPYYTTDGGLSWLQCTTAGLVDGYSGNEDSLMYDYTTGWYYYVQKNGDAAMMFQSRDPQEPWVGIGIYTMPGYSGYSNYQFRYLPNLNRFAGFVEASSNWRLFYRDNNFISGTYETEWDFATNATTDAFFARTDIGVGTYIEQTSNNTTKIGVISFWDPPGKRFRVQQGNYGPSAQSIGKAAFTNSVPFTISDTQHAFGVSSVSGSTISGKPRLLSDHYTKDFNVYDGKSYESEEKVLTNANRYLIVEPNGDVSGYSDTPVGHTTYLTDYTIQFPANAPTGQSWDAELPAGTALTTGVAAFNVEGRDPSSGYYEESIVPGASVFLSEDDVKAQEARFLSFDYRKLTHQQDLIAQRDALVAKLAAEGYTAQDIEDLI